MFKIVINPNAESDSTEAVVWYNLQREGLGEDFLLALEAKLNEIQRNPNQFTSAYKNVKRAFLKRFPYGVFFIIEGNTIYILAIIHSSRSPKIWQKRK